MLEVLIALGDAGLVALWMPVIIWTGVAGMTMLALVLARGMHPLIGYHYPAYSRLMQRLTLLNEMLRERIREFEILRMKQETERRLKEPAS